MYMCERLKDIYKKITQDTKIKELYKKVDECNNNMWAFHGLQHVNNVDKMVEKVLKKLNCSSEQIYKAKICAYLHDIGAVNGKDGHAKKSAEFCREYFNNFNLTQAEKDEMIFAIENHGNYIQNSGLLHAVLIFSDKLDIDKTRISQSGYKIDGMKEMQWINKVFVDINDKLIINFECHKNFNKQEFEDYYFCQKVFDSINSFSNIIGKKQHITLNGKQWDYKRRRNNNEF